MTPIVQVAVRMYSTVINHDNQLLIHKMFPHMITGSRAGIRFTQVAILRYRDVSFDGLTRNLGERWALSAIYCRRQSSNFLPVILFVMPGPGEIRCSHSKGYVFVVNWSILMHFQLFLQDETAFSAVGKLWNTRGCHNSC